MLLQEQKRILKCFVDFADRASYLSGLKTGSPQASGTMGSSQYEYMERKRMETEQKGNDVNIKKIICKIFGEQIRVIGESSAIGPARAKLQIRFFL